VPAVVKPDILQNITETKKRSHYGVEQTTRQPHLLAGMVGNDSMRLTDRFAWGTRTYVMGILNITPDSFSGDGLAGDRIDSVVAEAQRFAAAGADILDIGGESTRPGAQPVTAAEECGRVVPVIRAVREALPDSVISVDTYRADVADAALTAGADLINDVWGLRADQALAACAAERGAPVVLMHNRSKPDQIKTDARLGGAYLGAPYDDLLADISRELLALAANAEAAGIDRDQIILDPGLGFGKTAAQNLVLINRFDHFKDLGFPLLVGPSRKSFLGQILDAPVDDRLEGTAAAVAMSIARGADIVRVHDVKEMVRVARTTDAILRASPDG
jgi:dihydropteroate synthase